MFKINNYLKILKQGKWNESLQNLCTELFFNLRKYNQYQRTMKNYIFCQIELTYSMAAAAVKWLKYFRHGVKQYPINQLATPHQQR